MGILSTGGEPWLVLQPHLVFRAWRWSRTIPTPRRELTSAAHVVARRTAVVVLDKGVLLICASTEKVKKQLPIFRAAGAISRSRRRFGGTKRLNEARCRRPIASCVQTP